MKKTVYLLLSLWVLGIGCIKKSDLDFKHIQVDDWTPDWAVPLVYGNLTMKNLIKTGDLITVDQNGLYSLHYFNNIFTVKASDYIKIPDQIFTTPGFTLTNPISSPSYTGTVNDSSSGHYNYVDTNGAHLNHINIKSGNIHLLVSNTFKQNVTVSIVFPTITKAGIPLSISSAITYPASSTDIYANLAGYILDCTNGGTTNNYVAYKMYFTLTGTGQPIVVSDNISAHVDITSLNYSFIDGFLGRYTIPIPPHDTIHVNVFNQNIVANIYLKNPSLKLRISNSFGISATANLYNIYTITNKNESQEFTIPAININGAPSVNTTGLTEFTIDSTNSSIQTTFNPGPNKVVYDGSFSLNAGLTSGYNFISDTSTLNLGAEVIIPACIKIYELSVGDTLQLQLPQDTSLVQYAQFKLLTENGFPLYGAIQLYFTDNNYNIIDSLIRPNGSVVHEAPVDGNGIVTGTTRAVTTFTMEHASYNAMANKTKYVIIKSNLYTSGTSTVQIHDVNFMNVKLALRFTLDVPQTPL